MSLSSHPVFQGKIYEKLCFFKVGQFGPWFAKLENFNNQTVAFKKYETWKWVRTKHISGMSLRAQENYYGVKLPKNHCSPLTHKSIIESWTFWT